MKKRGRQTKLQGKPRRKKRGRQMKPRGKPRRKKGRELRLKQKLRKKENRLRLKHRLQKKHRRKDGGVTSGSLTKMAVERLILMN